MTRQWVLVTGASRGIGRAVAEQLAMAGYGIVLWARTAADLAEVANGVRAPTRVAAVNVSDPAAVRQAAETSLRAIPYLRAVILNAGAGVWNRFSDISVDEWRTTLGVNLDGAFYTLRETLPLLRGGKACQVIGIASDSALYPFPERTAYCTSKAGMKALLDSVRLETRLDGVRTTLIMPSRVDSYFGDKRPGERIGALQTDDIASIVQVILQLPTHVEVRELHMASINSSFGPFYERLTPQ